MRVPDYTDPVIILGLMLICVYAYIGGKWLDKRYKANAEKLEKEERKKRLEDYS